MEAFAKVLSIAIPFFIILIGIEAFIAWRRGKKINNAFDLISSLSSGMSFTLKEIIGLSVIIISYGYMVEHLALFELKASLWLYVIAFIGIDFAGYWTHRFNHMINLFWNRHIIHHSSEEFNLACALRQNVSAIVSIYFFLYIPLAIIGVPAKTIAVVAPIQFFAQFWYHTQLINKMGFLEYIIVTPSHHRVHHAINPEYIDKNFAEIFIIWDKLFGTFQEELKEVPAVYGILKPAKTWNPYLINFMHLSLLIKDAWRTNNWLDKIRIWFMPTGWRPEDVKEKYPVNITNDVFERPKYSTYASNGLKVWSWIQLLITNLLFLYILIHIGDFNYLNLVYYAAFLSISIFSYTSLMDRDKLAVLAESIKFLLGVYLIVTLGNWFDLEQYLPGATPFMLAYLLTSLVITIYYSFFENSLNRQINLAP